ncbi:MAG: tRNA lysidine(34) synthetase TilS [Erysipelotrichales bacterium]|nr:tRNA lysidine(34) synthetase TilS [Erysipelotrichales bacterium]
MDNVLSYIKKLNLDKKETLVVACSGGPDSMFLLALLNSLKYKVICAHVNHKVRCESDDEYLFVKDYCEKNDIIFEGTELTGYSTGNFEHFARNFRYSFFESILKKYNSKYLFTAHHGDDLVETILMRLVRGSSLKGYKGFSIETKRNNYTIIRPLVYLTKDFIIDYNKEHNNPYVVDNSNEADYYTRNRFRHNVLPSLKEEDTLVHEKFLKFSEELDEVYEYVNDIVENKIIELYVDNSLDINKFNQEDNFIKKQILLFILRELYPDNLYLVDSNHIDEINKVIESDKPNISIKLPNNINVIREYNKLIFNKNNSEATNYCYELVDGLTINDHVFEFVETESNSNYVIRLNSKDIKLPLSVRTRENGDKIKVKNMDGTKKLNDIFIDMKMNKMKRDSWPIVVDANNEIIWIPGLKKSQFDIPISEEYDIIIKYQKKGEKDYE